MKKKFAVTGISCTACVKHIEEAVKSLSGVQTCRVNLTTNTLFVEFTCKEDDIISTVKKCGYGIENPEKKEKFSTADRIKVILSAVLLLLLVLVSMTNWVPNKLLNGVCQLVLSLPILVIRYRYFVKGAIFLWKRKPTMDSLICIGSGVAFLSSIISLILYKGDGKLYFEASAMIVTFVSAGKFLEGKSKQRTADALEKLIALTPDQATILENGTEKRVLAKDISVGNTVIVRQDEKIPCDGTVLCGNGYADESVLTGESMPKEIKEGAYVLGGTNLISGFIEMKAEKTGAETVLAGVIESVEQAQNTKPRLARIADKVASYFVPTVLSIALVTFVVWAIVGNWQQGVSSAVAVLVVSCPCALGLATPVAVSVGIGKGAKRGILFKTGESIENLHKAKTFLFDKTGTLTEGKPTVIGTYSYGIEEKTLLAIVAGAEKQSTHPLANAIREYALNRGIAPLTMTDFSAQFGKGVTATANEKVFFVGKGDFIQENCGVEVPSLQEGTTVFVGEKGLLLGYITLSDKLRKESKSAVDFLKSKKIKCILLTGDNQTVAEKIGKECGMDEVIANVLPTEKSFYAEKCKQEGCTVMVGDGINDAPALTVADVGIGVGGGSEIALESCDLVLLHGGTEGAVDAYKISCDTVRNIKQNLFWAFFYNILSIPLATGITEPLFGWTISPVLSSAMMSLSSLIVVCNAMRYKYIHGGKLTMFGKKETNGMVLKVEGMMCDHCKNRVEQAVQSVGAKGTVDLKKKTVALSEGADVEAVVKAIIDAGYEVKR